MNYKNQVQSQSSNGLAMVNSDDEERNQLDEYFDACNTKMYLYKFHSSQ